MRLYCDSILVLEVEKKATIRNEKLNIKHSYCSECNSRLIFENLIIED